MIDTQNKNKPSLFCFLSQNSRESMYEEIDMLFHHGYRTRVLMNSLDQIQMYGEDGTQNGH